VRVWTSGDVTLYHGDCLEIMPTLADGSVDAVVTDLPYGTTQCQWDSRIDLRCLWEQYERLLCDRGTVVLFGAQPFTSTLVMSRPDWFRWEWIWQKTSISGFLSANRRPLGAHESILVFSPNGATYNPQMRIGRLHKRGRRQRKDNHTAVYGAFHDLGEEWTNEFYPTTVLHVGQDPDTTVTLASRPDKRERHPTQKPLELMRYLVATHSNDGDMVLDNTMGSGTTGVACVQTGRKFVGIEIDEGYFEIAKQRIIEAQMQPRLEGLDA
jgi:DNA modification methylase